MRNPSPRHLGASFLFILLATASCASTVDPSESTATGEEAFVAESFAVPTPGDGTYTLHAIDSRCVDIDTPAPMVGSRVISRGCTGAATQQLRVVATSPLSTVVTLRIGDLCFGPQPGVPAASAVIMLGTCDGSASQSWEIVSVRSGLGGGTLQFDWLGGGPRLYLEVYAATPSASPPLELSPLSGPGINKTFDLTSLEIVGAVPTAPAARESRFVVRDHRGVTTVKRYTEKFDYQDRSNIETGYEIWMKSYDPSFTTLRPWAKVGSAPALAGTGLVGSFRPTLEANRVYYLAARAIDAAGASGPGAALVWTTPPDPARNATVTKPASGSANANTSLVVDWQSPSARPERVDGYRVHYGSQTLDVGNVPQVTIGNLAAGTSYCFDITAYNDIWGSSAPVKTCGTTGGGTAPPPKYVDLYPTYIVEHPDAELSTVPFDIAWTECNAGSLDSGPYQWSVTIDEAFHDPWQLAGGTMPSLGPHQCRDNTAHVGLLPAGFYEIYVDLATTAPVVDAYPGNNQASDGPAITDP